MDVPKLERPVLLLEVSTPQHRSLNCTWTCLDDSSLCSSCTYLHCRYLYCTRNFLHTESELHLDLSSLQSPVLHLDGFPLYRARSWTWSCLDSSLHVLLLVLTIVYTTDSCAVPGRVFTTGALAAPGLVHTTEPCAAPRSVYFTGVWAAPGTCLHFRCWVSTTPSKRPVTVRTVTVTGHPVTGHPD